MKDTGVGYRVSGFKCMIQGFEFCLWGSGFGFSDWGRVSGFRNRDSGFKIGVKCFGFSVSRFWLSFGFGVSGLVVRVSDYGFRFSMFGFQFSDFGIRI